MGGVGNGGGVAAYDGATGTREWSLASPENGSVENSPIVANGLLYFGTENGGIYAYTA